MISENINNALAGRAVSGRDDARSAESASHRGKSRKGGAQRPARAERTPRRRCSAAAAAAQGTSTLLRRQLEYLPRKTAEREALSETKLHTHLLLSRAPKKARTGVRCWLDGAHA